MAMMTCARSGFLAVLDVGPTAHMSRARAQIPVEADDLRRRQVTHERGRRVIGRQILIPQGRLGVFAGHDRGVRTL